MVLSRTESRGLAEDQRAEQAVQWVSAVRGPGPGGPRRDRLRGGSSEGRGDPACMEVWLGEGQLVASCEDENT